MEPRGHPASSDRFSPRFFVEEPAQPAAGDQIALSADDSRHAYRVLRLRPGDGCEVVASSGQVFGAVVAFTGDRVLVRLEAELDATQAGAGYRHLVGIVQALARPSAVDLVLEKGTEVGASFFLLLQAEGSPRAHGRGGGRQGGEGGGGGSTKLERRRRIIREAAKQSKQIVIPSVEMVASVEEALERMATEGIVPVVLEPDADATLQEVVAEVGAAGAAPAGGAAPEAGGSTASGVGVAPLRIALWIGPEGGWSPAERELFTAAGVRMARLGRGVLRTETAGPVSTALTRYILGDW